MKLGQPVRRDCACRGTDAGFVHLSCLTDYAKNKSIQARDMNEFRKLWHTCPSCHQEYQNELAVVRPKAVSRRYTKAGGGTLCEAECS